VTTTYLAHRLWCRDVARSSPAAAVTAASPSSFDGDSSILAQIRWLVFNYDRERAGEGEYAVRTLRDLNLPKRIAAMWMGRTCFVNTLSLAPRGRYARIRRALQLVVFEVGNGAADARPRCKIAYLTVDERSIELHEATRTDLERGRGGYSCEIN